VSYAEVRLGDAVVMVASAEAAYVRPPLLGRSTGDGLYLWFPDATDVDSWHRRAVDAGARRVFPPEEVFRTHYRHVHAWDGVPDRPDSPSRRHGVRIAWLPPGQDVVPLGRR
jgi:hypothetical protein